MADGINKDVVGARINLDTSKILSSFKTINEGARGNAESFKVLNTELAVTEKNYTSLASSADKLALTSDERKKKILAESEALVKQRTAQTELLSAKKNQLDQTNSLVESKLQAQQAIVKQREAAIEQQELQHQQRMATLQQKTTAASSQDNLIQAKIDRQFQLMKNGDAKLEMEAERHAAAMNRLDQVSASSSNGFLSKIGQYAEHALVFHTVTSAINEAQHALKEGLVDIESNMAGYVQTNEHYFLDFNEATQEATMNTQKLHDETVKFIQTTHELGSEITDVTESARLWGRMYKDVNIVQELVRQSTKLSTVDLVGLEDSTKMMESVMSQYAVHIETANDAMVVGNRVLDSWSKVAHETMAPARDLGAAFERTGKIAAETGVSFDFMNGLVSSGIRNTALSGENLGNMWKTVLGTIRTDKAVGEIERLGVATKEVVDGTEQWRKAEDILLDLSVKVVDKNYDLTQSYADISRGVYQFAKLAASLNAGDILLGTAASIGSTGSTMDYLKVQMDTIQRKAASTKASLLEIFNTAGDDGLRRTIKDVLDALDQLLIGLTKVPTSVFGVTASLGGLLLAYKLLQSPITNLVTASKTLYTTFSAGTAATTANTAATAAKTVATAANTAANEVNIISSEGATLATVAKTTADGAAIVAEETLAVAAGATTAVMSTQAAVMTVATGGLVLIAGVLALVAMNSGKAEKAERERIQTMKDNDSAAQQMISQYQRQAELLPKLQEAHQSLQQTYDAGTLSAEKQSQVKKQLDEVSKALVMTLGEEEAKQVELANYSDEAIKAQIANLNDLIAKQQEARKDVLEDQRNELIDQQTKKQQELTKATEDYAIARAMAATATADNAVGIRWINDAEKLRLKTEELSRENNELVKSISDVDVQYAQLTLAMGDALDASSGKAVQSTKDLEEELSYLREEIGKNGSAITDTNQLLEQLSKGQSLNAANAAELILKYPELTDKIHKTADGWAFEKDAVELLRKAKIQKAIDDLKSEEASAFNTKMATDDRLKMYGIEMQAIKNLAELKAKLNGSAIGDYADTNLDTLSTNPVTRKNSLEAIKKNEMISTIVSDYENQQKEYENKIKSLSALYKDPKYGADSSGSKKASKSGSSKKKDTTQSDAFNAAQNQIEHQKAMGQLTTSQELAAWQKVQSQFKQGSEQRMKSDEKVYALKKQLAEEAQKKEKEAYDASMNWISHQKAIKEVSAAQELEMLQRVQARYKAGTEERKQLDEKVYAAKKAAEQESFSNSEEWISHQKAIGQLSAEEELKAWQRIQARYLEGTKQRMQADEQVYALKKKFLDDEQKAVTELAKVQKTTLDKAKNEAVKRIEEERDAFLSAQDDKIKAIDDEIKKMGQANDEDDYERKLAEKQARLELLQSAVGPDGIKERDQVQKDIEEMQREHDRKLAKQGLEDQKQQLQNEKTQKEKDYNDQIQAAKAHYDELSTAFDSFSSDVELKAENLKQIQILKESEKNEEILNQLDQFIADYQSKMNKITHISLSQKELDLEEYNSNKDAYDAAKASGNKAEMNRLASRNQQIRDQYGVTQDTGKLQHFKEGGVVQGQKGQAVPVVAHAGEMYLNDQQQSNLFKLLNFKTPKFSMPDPVSFKTSSQNPVEYHNHFAINSGDTYIEDESSARVYWSERDTFIRRTQARTGAKVQ
ncbi:transglycosylase [Paenibacillus dokdonensis]|uniref:Transglycosylase n=1 Tax=Paenibacillus dokdonensis TaxID=2567944 RepID=A0ABU6GRF9_9BACL|nr:transglycosylase [Paenibacillus dokdonensis]MEC0241978.1 transglycosylase [Paenibacillus dokdonensis]